MLNTLEIRLTFTGRNLSPAVTPKYPISVCRDLNSRTAKNIAAALAALK